MRCATYQGELISEHVGVRGVSDCNKARINFDGCHFLRPLVNDGDMRKSGTRWIAFKPLHLCRVGVQTWSTKLGLLAPTWGCGPLRCHANGRNKHNSLACTTQMSLPVRVLFVYFSDGGHRGQTYEEMHMAQTSSGVDARWDALGTDMAVRELPLSPIECGFSCSA